MAIRQFSAPPFAFDLRVSLRDIQPEIGLLIRMPRDIRMDRLHAVLQAAFGWMNSHLHQFIVECEGPVPVFVPENPANGRAPSKKSTSSYSFRFGRMFFDCPGSISSISGSGMRLKAIRIGA